MKKGKTHGRELSCAFLQKMERRALEPVLVCRSPPKARRFARHGLSKGSSNQVILGSSSLLIIRARTVCYLLYAISKSG